MMVAESHQSPRASSQDRSCRPRATATRARRSAVPCAGSRSARGAGSPGRQLETLQPGGGAQLHGADAGRAGASPRRVRARVELAVERLR